MDRERFEWLVARSVQALPKEFVIRARLKRGQTLFGLYEGVPLTKRGAHYGLVVPDKITIFQGPIESACRDDAEITAEIQRVVQHEIAHHFGIGDARLRQLGK
jgi:predicted Zn-dependent protease with MMP-like domain